MLLKIPYVKNLTVFSYQGVDQTESVQDSVQRPFGLNRNLQVSKLQSAWLGTLPRPTAGHTKQRKTTALALRRAPPNPP